MRFRTDCWGIANMKAINPTRPEGFDPVEWDATPAAEPGDVWRSTWYKAGDEIGPPAGYLIGCPTCRQVHGWSTANNCASRRMVTGTNSDGTSFTYPTCDHQGVGSCWTWTGSAEDGTLTASPSLHCPKNKGGCGFHGWLENGELRDC